MGLISALDAFRGSDFLSVAVKLCFAVLAGGVLGLERRRKRRPAGFRTYILVTLGATLAVCLNLYLFDELTKLFPQGYDKLDVSRLGAQVINGIGFLGAGTIIVTGRQQIKGLTTAAGLWASACMGLAIGAGYFECALLAAIFIYITVTLFNGVERWMNSHAKNMNLNVIVTDTSRVRAVTDRLKKAGAEVYDVEIVNIRELATESPNLIIETGLKSKQLHRDMIMQVASVPGVIAVEEI